MLDSSKSTIFHTYLNKLIGLVSTAHKPLDTWKKQMNTTTPNLHHHNNQARSRVNIRSVFNFAERLPPALSAQDMRNQPCWLFVDEMHPFVDDVAGVTTKIEERKIGTSFVSHWTLGQQNKSARASPPQPTPAPVAPAGQQENQNLYLQMYVQLVGLDEFNRIEKQHKTNRRKNRVSIQVADLLNATTTTTTTR